MGEKFTSRVGYLIRNFRIASDMTQKELADKCGLNESTIRNYELGNRYPDEATLLNIANNLGVSFYALSDPDVANIFSALHVLFDIEWAYGLRPTMKDGEGFQVPVLVHRKTLITSERWLSIGHVYETSWRMEKYQKRNIISKK